MINFENINISVLKDEFLNKQKVIIDNVLIPEFADIMHNFYLNEIPQDWWHASFFPSINGDHHEHIQNNLENYHKIKMYETYVKQCLNDPMYSYFFYRTVNDHYESCNCLHCKIESVLKSDRMVQMLNDITDLNLINAKTIFANRYTSNCFLSTHTDDGNGRLAFVLHLTKYWNACWGGLYMDHSDLNNIKTIIPSFNKLIIFKVGQHETPHSVSPVANDITHQRLSITGWYE